MYKLIKRSFEDTKISFAGAAAMPGGIFQDAIYLNSDIEASPLETEAIIKHEEIHLRQARMLGWWKYNYILLTNPHRLEITTYVRQYKHLLRSGVTAKYISELIDSIDFCKYYKYTGGRYVMNDIIHKRVLGY